MNMRGLGVYMLYICLSVYVNVCVYICVCVALL